ncbi:MAG: hypothetical protein ACD_21C00032G0012 [uncultured bacterium]|nr:MAG: hypothetical protein ACD_21C00032G0012 [uncultured bacterium]
MSKEKTPCQCQCKCKSQKPVYTDNKNHAVRHISLHLIGITLWWLIYTHLKQLSTYATYSLLHIKNPQLGDALEFFFYDVPKIFMLLALVVYGVGIMRSFITPEKSRRFLANKNEFLGNICAAILGIATPFCSCSAVALFIGFVTAGIPLGVTFSFLIAAPLVNEVAVILLYGLLGWKIAALYLSAGLGIAIIAGLVIGRVNPEKYLETWVKELRNSTETTEKTKITWHGRIVFAYDATKDVLGKIWLYILVGIAAGAFIHGYIPTSFLAMVMGSNSWWSVPLAVLLGIPLYAGAAGVLPIVEALISKGAAIGTTLAFMMSVIALSFPEMVILRKVLKPQLIGVFIITVILGIVIVGYLFNWII